MRILLVEDDDATANYLEAVMRDIGHHVDRVSDGAHAITAALSRRYDALICDLGLPDLHGTDVIRALKAQAPHLPVIVVTALDPIDWKDAALAAGASGFLQKPVRVQVLREELEFVEKSNAALQVLVVAPDDLNRKALSRRLRDHGAIVETVEELNDGALSPAETPRPSIVLIDVSMTAALAALSLCRARGIPAVAITGNGALDDDTLMRAGAALVLPSPVDVDGLMIQTRFLVGA